MGGSPLRKHFPRSAPRVGRSPANEPRSQTRTLNAGQMSKAGKELIGSGAPGAVRQGQPSPRFRFSLCLSPRGAAEPYLDLGRLRMMQAVKPRRGPILRLFVFKPCGSRHTCGGNAEAKALQPHARNKRQHVATTFRA